MAEITVEASLNGITLIVVPDCGGYRIEDRTDDRDVVTLRTQSTINTERWVVTHGQRGKLVVVSYITQAAEVRAMQAGRPYAYTKPLVIQLPAKRRSTVEVRVGRDG
jgi:hypothetical protein